MSAIHPEAPVRTPPPRPAQGPTPRSRRTVAIVGVTALVLALLGGYLLRWGTEAGNPVPRAPAGAYTASTTAHAEVYFDGSRAFYSGPAELMVGTRLTIHFTTAVNGASVAVSWLDPAPTWDKLVADITTANTSAAPMPMPYVHGVTSGDGSGATVAPLDRPGVYSVWAGPVAGPAGAPTVALATILRVTR